MQFAAYCHTPEVQSWVHIKVVRAVDLVPSMARALEDAATGAGDPWAVQVGAQGSSDSLLLLPDDKQLTLRLFLDGTVAEAYWMGGRVAMTVDTARATNATVSATSAVTLISASVFAMGDIHTTVDDVLAQQVPH